MGAQRHNRLAAFAIDANNNVRQTLPDSATMRLAPLTLETLTS
jgi:hypothetical protein